MKRILVFAAGVAALAGAARGGDHFFTVQLSGLQEVNGGDPDGFGTAMLRINDDDPSNPFIDWEIEAFDILMPLTGAHIHEGDAGTNGPVRIDFNSQLSGAGLVDIDLNGVLANPTGWYVNLHNADFPGGAIRGQIPVPATGVVLGAAALAARRRR